MSETNTRVQILNTFLQSPHGKLTELASVHKQAIRRDPDFYGHLGVWFSERGEIRDHWVLFVAHLLTSRQPGHRQVGWALAQRLPPHMLSSAVNHAKRTIGKMPRIFRNAVRHYLHTLEAQPERFDHAVLRNRNALKHLYATLHLAPGARAQQILFAEAPPEGSALAVLHAMGSMTDPEEQAIAILVHRIPFTTAVGALRAITPSVLVALIDVMSPQEVINHLKMLTRHGAFDNTEVRELIEEKLRLAEVDPRVSTLKANRARQAVALDTDMQAALTTLVDQRVAGAAHITRPTALFVDKSSSMTQAIQVAREIAALISAVCDEFRVVAFDTDAFAITAAGTEHSDWLAAFARLHADGGTSIGAPLAKLQRERQRVEQVIVVTDGGENTAPFFAQAHSDYATDLGVTPMVIVVGVGRYDRGFSRKLELQGIEVTTWEFSGDYYSLPNLLPLLVMPSRAELVEAVMALPLPTLAAAGGM